MPYTYIPNLKVLIPRDASREAESLWVNERADHVNTPVAGKAEIWVKNDANQTLMVTDDAGVDRTVADSSGTGSVNATYYDERADHVNTPVAGKAEIWVKDDAPTTLMFTNDDGQDSRLVGDPIALGAWAFRQATISTPGVGQFDTNNALLVATTQIRFVSTGNKEGWVRNWLDELPSPGYIVLRKKDSPSEEVVFSYATITDTASAYSNFNTLVYQNDTTADTNWATTDEWSLFVHPTAQGVLAAGTTAQDAALFTERADHVNTPTAGEAELWVRNDTAQAPVFTDDAAVDEDLRSKVTYWEYDSSTSAGSGGAGTFRFNNATVTSATAAYFDDTDLDGTNAVSPLGFLQPGQIMYLVKADDRTQRVRIEPSSSTNNTTYLTISFSTYSPGGSTNWTNPTDGDRFYLEFGPISYRGGGNASLWASSRSTSPGGTTGAGKFFVRTDGTNTAPPVQTPWFGNDDAYEYRLGMQSTTITGEVSPTSGSTWYSWGAGGPYNDTIWADDVGAGAAPTTSSWFTRPPLILIPGDAYIERVVGWYQSESASVGTWQMELLYSSIEDADTVVGTIDVIVDGSVNADFSVTNAKVTLLSHTVNDRTIQPTDTNHMGGLYMAFQETTGSPLNVDLRFNVTIYWSTLSFDGWVSDGFAAS